MPEARGDERTAYALIPSVTFDKSAIGHRQNSVTNCIAVGVGIFLRRGRHSKLREFRLEELRTPDESLTKFKDELGCALTAH